MPAHHGGMLGAVRAEALTCGVLLLSRSGIINLPRSQRDLKLLANRSSDRIIEFVLYLHGPVRRLHPRRHSLCGEGNDCCQCGEE
jgi:hypothetical protein